MRWLALCASLALLAFGSHKFYVSISQISIGPDHKTLQFDTRIFTDDLSDALENRYKHRFHLGEKNESDQDRAQLQQYLTEKIALRVNGQPQKLGFVKREYENNVVICYFLAVGATQIKTVEVKNDALFELFPEQQHIVNANIGRTKKSLMLTADERSGTLKFD